jgi:hypothetical protein
MAVKRRRRSKTARSRRVTNSQTGDFQGSKASSADWFSIFTNYVSIAASVLRIAICFMNYDK